MPFTEWNMGKINTSGTTYRFKNEFIIRRSLTKMILDAFCSSRLSTQNKTETCPLRPTRIIVPKRKCIKNP